jgi:hypothetical protein
VSAQSKAVCVSTVDRLQELGRVEFIRATQTDPFSYNLAELEMPPRHYEV